MTREESRQIITDWLDWLEECKVAKGRGYIEGHFNEEDVEAFRMAIEALNALPTHRGEESQRVQGVGSVGWIPCSERLPRYDETSEYLVTDKEGRVRHCCLDPYMPETFVTVEEGMIVDAVAWRQAPDPYRKEDEE